MKHTIIIVFCAITTLIIVAATWHNEIFHKILVTLFGVTIGYLLYLAIVIKMAVNEQKHTSGTNLSEQAAE